MGENQSFFPLILVQIIFSFNIYFKYQKDQSSPFLICNPHHHARVTILWATIKVPACPSARSPPQRPTF